MPAKKKSSGKAKAKAKAKAEKAAKKAAQEDAAAEPAAAKSGYFYEALDKYLEVPERHRWLRLRVAELDLLYRFMKMGDDKSWMEELSPERYDLLSLPERKTIHALIALQLKNLEHVIIRHGCKQVAKVLGTNAVFHGIEPQHMAEYKDLTSKLVMMCVHIALAGKNTDLLDALLSRMSPPIIGASVLFAEQDRYLADLFDADMPGIDVGDRFEPDRDTLKKLVKHIPDTAWIYARVRHMELWCILELWRKSFVSSKSKSNIRFGDSDPWALLMSVDCVSKQVQEMFIYLPTALTPKQTYSMMYSIVTLECSFCLQSIKDSSRRWVHAVIAKYMRVTENKVCTLEELEKIEDDLTSPRIIELAQRVKDVAPVSETEIARDPGVFFKCPGENHSVWRLCESCYLEHVQEGRKCAFDFCRFAAKDFKVDYFRSESTGFSETLVPGVSETIANMLASDDPPDIFALNEAMSSVCLDGSVDDDAGGGDAEAGMAFRGR